MNTDILAECFSYFSSIMFGNIWNRSSKNYKLPKKKETIKLRCGLIRKKQFPRFPSFRFWPIPKIENSEISESFIYLIFGNIWKSKSKKWPKRKNFNFTIWFEKIKYPSLRFPSFWFWPLLEIENLETSESFALL